MTAERIEDADADGDAICGHGASRGSRQYASRKRIFRKPTGGESACVSDTGQVNALPTCQQSMQANADFWELSGHVCFDLF
jgi:hypothetical protein